MVAYTTEADEFAEVRHAAEGHAIAHGCVVILYAADVASWWSEPMPNQWGSEGEGDRFGDRLSPKDLDVLGRSAIAAQVLDSRRAGAKASAWLPKDKGVGALAGYASAQSAHIVFVPGSLDPTDELRALLAAAGDDIETARPAVKLEVVPRPDPDGPSSGSRDPGSEPG